MRAVVKRFGPLNVFVVTAGQVQCKSTDRTPASSNKML